MPGDLADQHVRRHDQSREERLLQPARSGTTSGCSPREPRTRRRTSRAGSRSRLHLRAYAGLDKDCVVVGAINRVEVWDAAAWEQYSAEKESAFAELNETLFPGPAEAAQHRQAGRLVSRGFNPQVRLPDTTSPVPGRTPRGSRVETPLHELTGCERRECRAARPRSEQRRTLASARWRRIHRACRQLAVARCPGRAARTRDAGGESWRCWPLRWKPAD